MLLNEVTIMNSPEVLERVPEVVRVVKVDSPEGISGVSETKGVHE